MQANNKCRDKLWELQGIVAKMPLTLCCSVVLPEFGLRWKEVSRAVRNSRLPMQSSSVARVLCQYLEKSLPKDELDGILPLLKLKLVAQQPRAWHVLHLHEPRDGAPTADRLQSLPRRVLLALRDSHKGAMRPQVHSIMSGDLLYLSVQFVSDTRESPALYVASPPAAPVALVSALAADKLLKACVAGLGYESYVSAELRGADIPSLLRIARGACGAPCLAPEYAPQPAPTGSGIDYTHAGYDRDYVDAVIGPDPPLLTELTVKASSEYFNPEILNKTINLTLHVKSENIATTLKSWVENRAITADSPFISVIHKTRSNKITYNKDASDSE